MADSVTSTIHPGAYIKASIIPSGMSVTKAAKLLGVGRPALSNLLNGHASLSPEMALRLEKAFGAKREALLQMQASYDELQMRRRDKEVAVRVYAPSFMDITATQISAWAGKTVARSELAAFLRRLVLTTGSNLTKVDFPAYDNAQRHGWDGQVETDTATPWIPSGVSGWEFGCDKDPRKKAEDDYAARVASIPVAEQKGMTFIFVTPRNWPGKDEWAKTKRAEQRWKDVKAFDASDLEQWLGQSVPAQSWMAEKLGIGSDDILSLDECWSRWAKVTRLELSKELFRGAIQQHKDKLAPWLNQPPSQPLVVAADSEEEALAFVACALESLGVLPGEYYARAVVVRSISALRKTTTVSSAFIPVIASAETESASAGIHKVQHTIIIRPRNAVVSEPDIALDLVDDATFRTALTAMGIPDQEIPIYAGDSGQSLTILRRRLSDVPEIKVPPWAHDSTLTRKLVPLGLTGVWNSKIAADQEILSFLTGDPYDTVEKTVAELRRSEQSLVWSVGDYRGVSSKIDVLYGIHKLVTKQDLDNFFFIARVVLSERDPSLDLPDDERYAAKLYGKTRDHSAALREGICETLVLLAVHGHNLFREYPGIDVRAHVNRIVRELLTPFSADTWASQRGDLPRYAEAAPDEFLDILETDLKSSDPKILSLLKPASSDFFGGGCPRSGLLWALELLAWNPDQLQRVVCLLARLSEPHIEDNWTNKPENSLKSIFRSWLPQTAASVEQRKAVLEALVRRFPQVGWQLCIDQFDPHATIGHYNHRPRWRKDASGTGQAVTRSEVYQFASKALDIAIHWPKHDEHTLGDLIERFQMMRDEDQEKVWDQVHAWIAAGPSEEGKAALRERIRRFVFTRRGRNLGVAGKTKGHAREVQELLLPRDPVIRHHWLFERQWVEESLEELEDAKFDVERHERKIAKLRAEALCEIWRESGYEGIVRLCESGEASWVIGLLIGAGKVTGLNRHEDLISRLVSEPAERSPWQIDMCIAGVLAKTEDTARDKLLGNLVRTLEAEGSAGQEKVVRLFKCAPFRRQTWRQVDQLGVELQTRYWQECRPDWGHFDREELHEVIDRLLAVNRPRTALNTVRFELKQIESKLLIRLLKEVATNGSEASGRYQIQPYDIVQAFKILDKRPDVSADELAHLEFMYLSALDGEERGIPNLERQIAESPQLFMQAIALAYKRGDSGEDPPEWRIDDEDARRNIATQAYRLLHNARRIPGTMDDGMLDPKKLLAWIVEVRALCSKNAREAVGDSLIGELLSKSPVGADGVWPHEGVRQALEETGSDEMAKGMSIGLYNQRGAHFRAPSGDAERELAAKYRNWSKQIALESPFTSRLLERIARTYDFDAEWHDTDANLRKRSVY
jgi:addiction module HigA family antidote